MSSANKLLQNIRQGALDRILAHLYGQTSLQRQRQRYEAAVQQFLLYFGPAEDIRIFSVPGRTELCGNHTDHQNGIGLAAAVNRDIIAVAAARKSDIVRVKSYGFDKLDIVDLRQQDRQQQENTHSASLIRGIGVELQRQGGQVGGFDAYTTSDVLRGSGLSSSAAFETMMGTIWNHFYNGARFSPLAVARIGQYAENRYFGKPCGLLDTLTCATGGILCVDLQNEEKPIVQRLSSCGLPQGFALCITDTRCSHSELTDAFAQVRDEMESVANALGRDNLRQAQETELWQNMPTLRKKCGDRAVLRALHFYKESQRSRRAYQALEAGETQSFLDCINESGHSAFEYNQNTRCAVGVQPIPLALAISQSVLGTQGAYRVQGSGFAGTIQAFVPYPLLEDYIRRMEIVFHAGCCDVMQVRPEGAIQVF